MERRERRRGRGGEERVTGGEEGVREREGWRGESEEGGGGQE